MKTFKEQMKKLTNILDMNNIPHKEDKDYSCVSIFGKRDYDITYNDNLNYLEGIGYYVTYVAPNGSEGTPIFAKTFELLLDILYRKGIIKSKATASAERKFRFKDGSVITASTVEEAKSKHKVMASDSWEQVLECVKGIFKKAGIPSSKAAKLVEAYKNIRKHPSNALETAKQIIRCDRTCAPNIKIIKLTQQQADKLLDVMENTTKVTASTVEEAKAQHKVIASEGLDLEKVVTELDRDSSLKQISPLNKAKSYVAYAYKYGDNWINGSACVIFWLRKKDDTITLKAGIFSKSGKSTATGYTSSRTVTDIDEIKSVISAKKKLFDKAQLAVKNLTDILSNFKK